MAAPTFNITSPSGTHVLFAAENSLQANSPTVAFPTNYIIPVKSGSIATTTYVSATPTVTASSAYTTGQEVGDLMTFANILTASASGILQSIRITSKTSQTALSLRLYLFDANPSNTTWTDKSTAAINVADIPSLFGVYKFPMSDVGLGTYSLWQLDSIGHVLSGSGTSIYGVLKAIGTPTFGATTDITVKIGVRTD